MIYLLKGGETKAVNLGLLFREPFMEKGSMEYLRHTSMS